MFNTNYISLNRKYIQYIISIMLVISGYYLGKMLLVGQEQFPTIFPLSGIAIALTYLWSNRVLIVICLCYTILFYLDYSDFNIYIAFISALGLFIQSISSVYIINRFKLYPRSNATTKRIILFTLIIGITLTLLPSILYSYSHIKFLQLEYNNFYYTYCFYLLSNITSVLIFVPLIISVFQIEKAKNDFYAMLLPIAFAFLYISIVVFNYVEVIFKESDYNQILQNQMQKNISKIEERLSYTYNLAKQLRDIYLLFGIEDFDKKLELKKNFTNDNNDLLDYFVVDFNSLNMSDIKSKVNDLFDKNIYFKNYKNDIFQAIENSLHNNRHEIISRFFFSAKQSYVVVDTRYSKENNRGVAIISVFDYYSVIDNALSNFLKDSKICFSIINKDFKDTMWGNENSVNKYSHKGEIKINNMLFWISITPSKQHTLSFIAIKILYINLAKTIFVIIASTVLLVISGKNDIITNIMGMKNYTLEVAKTSLEEKIKQRTKTLKLIQEVAISSNEIENLKDCINKIIFLIAKHYKWHDGELFYINYKNDSYRNHGKINYPENMAIFEKIVVSVKSTKELFYSEKITDKGMVFKGFGIPILIKDHVTAVLTFIDKDLKRPTTEVLHSMEIITSQIARVIERNMQKEILQADFNMKNKELKDTRKYIDGITENVPILLSYIDKDLKYRFVNKTYKNWFANTVSNLIGQDIRTVLGKEIISQIKTYLKQTFEGKATAFEIKVNKFADKNEPKYLHFSFSPDFSKGKVIGFFAAIEDITSIKEAQSKAEESTRLKSEFLATMSHEIRTPMNGIIGMTNLLKETSLSPKQSTYTETIQNSAEILLEIINDILDFSKIEADKLELENIPFNLINVIDEVVAIQALKAFEKNIKLLVRFDPKTPIFVVGDPSRLKQLFLNLISNSIKFTATGHVLLDVSINKKNYIFKVIDTGIGIPKNKHKLIFNKFDQADQSTTRNFGGTGLGLAICKKISNMMGGDIGVDSELGKGSVFWIKLPLQKDKKSKVKSFYQECKIENTQVAIIDDNKVTSDIYKEQLNALGANVKIYDDQYPLLNKINTGKRQNLPNIIIANKDTKSFSYTRFVQNFNKKHGNSDVVFILVTSSMKNAETTKIKRYDYNGYLVTPIKPYDFARMMHVICSKKSNNQEIPFLNPHNIKTQNVNKTKKSRFEKLQVLLVDDNSVNQMVGTAMLEQLGCLVTPAGNGLEALSLFKDQKFDIVFMDCQMPEMDGFTATKKIREYENSLNCKKNTPIVALTANAMQGDRDKCINAGMDDYLAKPIVPAKIEDALKRWVSNK